MTINVIQHDDRFDDDLGPFYNGAFSIASKYDFDDHFFCSRQYGWLQKKRELSEKVLSDFIKFL
jgi:hypothetical protein